VGTLAYPGLDVNDLYEMSSGPALAGRGGFTNSGVFIRFRSNLFYQKFL